MSVVYGFPSKTLPILSPFKETSTVLDPRNSMTDKYHPGRDGARLVCSARWLSAPTDGESQADQANGDEVMGHVQEMKACQYLLPVY